MDNNQNQQYQPQTPQDNSGKNMSIAALVCGILGIVGSWIPVVCYFTLVLAILGIVFGAKGMKKSKESGQNKGLAVAGLVLGIIGTAFAAIGVLCVICAAGIIGMGAVSSL
jgi:hypothetical protein